ncbi:SelB C-terminal domain-containing protein, partial [Staphylococcus sp. SIMBA_130]
LYVHDENWKQTIASLKAKTGQAFTLQEAKDVLNVSRKYLVPILEKLDNEGYTVRKDQERYWRVEK